MRRLGFLLGSFAITVLVGCAQAPTNSNRVSDSDHPASSSPSTAAPTTGANGNPEAKPAADQLQITDLQVGSGAVAETGKRVTVHYRGTFTDGKEFDSSRKHGEPFTFRLGAGQVIPGWDEGVKGMKVGGKRKLVVPPQMAYGEQGMPGAIPPNSTLIFEVELLDVK